MIDDLSTQFALPDGLQLYATAIERTGSRRDAETEAVRRLTAHAFGTGAGLEHNPDGSPFIKGSDAAISISHSQTHAFLAVYHGLRIGLDAEQPRQQLMRVAGKFLSEQEMNLWQTIDDLLTAWTIKEAVYKAAGTQGLPLTAIRLPEKDSPRPMAVIPGGRRFRLLINHTASHTITVALPAHE